MYGTRGRIGVIYPPSVAENLMTEFYKRAPDGMTLVVHTLDVDHFAGFLDPTLRDQVLHAAKLIAAREANCLVVAGAPFVNSLGIEGEQELLDELSAIGQCPAFTTQSAAVDAIRQLGAKEIVLVAPYDPGTTSAMADYLRMQGLVVHSREMDSAMVRLHRLDDASALGYIEDAAKDFPDADCIYIPGAQFPIPDIAMLDRTLPMPTVFATHALLWKAANLLEVHDSKFLNAGALLSTLNPESTGE